MLSFFTRKTQRPSLETQLDHLKACGIEMRQGLTKADFLDSYPESAYLKEPYVLLLVALGGVVEKPPFDHYRSDNIWHFDTECIEDHGAYAQIAERIKVLAGGEMPLENITDYVDIEEGKARLSFTLDGNAVTWEARVDDDWVDPDVFSHLIKLHAARRRQRQFIYCGLGQDCLIGYISTAQLAQLNALLKGTKVSFTVMTEESMK